MRLSVAALRAVGVTDSQIADAMDIMDDERRAMDRARQAKCRNNKRNRNECHVTHVTTKERSPTPPKENNIYNNIPITRASRGTRLPADWLPSENLLSWATSELGLAASLVQFESGAFRDHFWSAPGQRGVKIRWDSTWKNWMREAHRRSNKNQRPPPQSRTHAAINNVLQRFNGSAEDDDGISGPSLRIADHGHDGIKLPPASGGSRNVLDAVDSPRNWQAKSSPEADD